MRQLPINLELSRQLADELNTMSLRRRHAENILMQGNCYHDALDVVFHLGEGYYCEGWGLHMIPVEHAWVVYRGQIIDVSWEDDDLADCRYLATLALSSRRIMNTHGYHAPITWDRAALKRLGINHAKLQPAHQQRLFDLMNNKGD